MKKWLETSFAMLFAIFTRNRGLLPIDNSCSVWHTLFHVCVIFRAKPEFLKKPKANESARIYFISSHYWSYSAIGQDHPEAARLEATWRLAFLKNVAFKMAPIKSWVRIVSTSLQSPLFFAEKLKAEGGGNCPCEVGEQVNPQGVPRQHAIQHGAEGNRRVEHG